MTVFCIFTYYNRYNTHVINCTHWKCQDARTRLKNPRPRNGSPAGPGTNCIPGCALTKLVVDGYGTSNQTIELSCGHSFCPLHESCLHPDTFIVSSAPIAHKLQKVWHSMQNCSFKNTDVDCMGWGRILNSQGTSAFAGSEL